MTDRNNDRAFRTILWGVLAAILTLCVFQMLALARIERGADRPNASSAKLEKSIADLRHDMAELDGVVRKLDADQSFVQGDVAHLREKVDGIAVSLERARLQDGADTGPEPPAIDWTQPQLFENAKARAAEVGISLEKDEVRVPARFVLREGPIEYFAVLKGGKEHETVLSLLGNTPAGERRPRNFGARLNNALLALGFHRGTPARASAAGRTPPSGEPVYLFVEWEEKGEKVLVRAEDLVWDRVAERPMERGKWIYLGSAFAPGDDPQEPVFAADIEGEAVATYNSRTTIVDNASDRGGDDTVYLVATPRMPGPDVTACTLILRREDRQPTRTFKDPPRGDEPAKDPARPDAAPKDEHGQPK